MIHSDFRSVYAAGLTLLSRQSDRLKVAEEEGGTKAAGSALTKRCPAEQGAEQAKHAQSAERRGASETRRSASERAESGGADARTSFESGRDCVTGRGSRGALILT